jgi:2-polyprenyl-6-hydroxyphenyl methylase/3-demethylubiquinone-9 3-methyltransferase
MTYYSKRLSGSRLQDVYDLASPRVRRYLAAEAAFLASRIRAEDAVLELGCGYGRIDAELAGKAARVIGIDNALESVLLGRRLAAGLPNLAILPMDAVRLGFRPRSFDVVACVQNGICAFRVEPLDLLREAVRVTRPGGRILFSSYAERFWPHRLEWFQAQAAAGLVGEIDLEATRDGVIACRDGFRSGTMRPGQFESLCAELGLRAGLHEVDGSSLFCEILIPREKTRPSMPPASSAIMPQS